MGIRKIWEVYEPQRKRFEAGSRHPTASEKCAFRRVWKALNKNNKYSRDCSYQQTQQSPPLCRWWKLFLLSVFEHRTSRCDAPLRHSPPLSHCQCPARWRRWCNCSKGCRCQHLGSRSDEHKGGTFSTLEKRNKQRIRHADVDQSCRFIQGLEF